MKMFSVLAICLLLGGFALAEARSDYCAEARRAPLSVGDRIETLYWSDADSGRANGVCFRVGNVDAAETGGVGAFGGAKCEAERERGFLSKDIAIGSTKGRAIVITEDYGFDRYNRQVIGFSVDGEDWNDKGLSLGIYKSWPHRNGVASYPKPKHCE